MYTHVHEAIAWRSVVAVERGTLAIVMDGEEDRGCQIIGHHKEGVTGMTLKRMHSKSKET